MEKLHSFGIYSLMSCLVFLLMWVSSSYPNDRIEYIINRVSGAMVFITFLTGIIITLYITNS
jgi:hypothetical protein